MYLAPNCGKFAFVSQNALVYGCYSCKETNHTEQLKQRISSSINLLFIYSACGPGGAHGKVILISYVVYNMKVYLF